MNATNIDQVLAARRFETFTATGKAPNIILADSMAWSALESVLGGDPITAWALKVMTHTFDPQGEKGVKFQAEFARIPDDPDADE